MGRVLSILIAVLVLISSTSNSAMAATSSLNQEQKSPKEIYYSLTAEERAIFDEALMNSPELLEYHLKNVDSDFLNQREIEYSPLKTQNQSILSASVATSASELTMLMDELSTMNLPSEVLYSLQAMGASMVAAIADGPLPVGDILLAAATASTIIIVAANWDKVEPHWNDIVDAFQNAFSSYASKITSAFSQIEDEVKDVPSSNGISITVSGNKVIFDGTTFIYNVDAADITEKQKRKSRYYVAVLYNGSVYFYPTKIPTGIARGIMYYNDKRLGVLVTSKSYARGLCPYGRTDNAHGSTCGFLPHYHRTLKAPGDDSHCWYPY